MNSKKVNILLVFTILLIFSVVSKIFFNDFQNGWNAYEKKDYKTARELWLPLAEQGEPKAQFFLGFMHDMGFGVPENDKKANKWYQLAAEQGDSRAQLFTGFMYGFGYGTPKNYEKAIKWYQLASEQGYMQAKINIYKLAEKNSAEALEILLNDAKNGITEAKDALAGMREVELAVSLDYQKTLNQKKLSEEQKYIQIGQTMLNLVNLNNHAKTVNKIIGGAEVMIKAQNVMGLIYSKDQKVRLDQNKELKWYKPAEYSRRINKYNLAKKNSVEALQYLIRLSIDAEKGVVEAQFILATMYADGIGVSQDDKEALRWFYRIAKNKEKNDREGNKLNFKHKNIPQELKFLTNDAESGIAIAQWKLGRAYANGQYFLQDYEQAFKWYLLAAENGNSKAQYSLGAMYLGGFNVKPSEKEAIKWFRFFLGQTIIKLGQTNIQEQQAIYNLEKKNVVAALKVLADDAKHGIETAQYYLGELYRDGIAVERNYIRAYMWYYLSALQGNAYSSDKMISLEKIMSPKEILQAKHFGTYSYQLYDDEAIN
jgi:uncharacterized protein